MRFLIGNTNNNGCAVTATSNTFPDISNSRHYVTMSYSVASSSYTINFYLDGINVGNSTGVGANFGTVAVTNPLSMGYAHPNYNWANYKLSGYIDEPRIYNRALSS